MGVMRFLVPRTELSQGWAEAHAAYLSGFDGQVFGTLVELHGNQLFCHRTSAESGKLHVAWPVKGFGRPTVCTTSLSERNEPYLLLVELARGQIAQNRDQLAEWQLNGMAVPAEFKELDRHAYQLFSQSAAMQHEQDHSEKLARESLAVAYQAADVVTRSYTAQRLAFRRKRTARLPASLGCALNVDRSAAGRLIDPFRDAFSAVRVPIEWKSIEAQQGEQNWDACDALVDFCHDNKLVVLGGPLVDLATGGVPEWLWHWERDPKNVQSFVCDFVETAIGRYTGKIRLWELCARANSGGALVLNEEDRLALTLRALDVARQIDDELQLVLRIDQPWGGYQARGRHRLSAIQFVDVLLRSAVGLSAVNLEIAVGYRPRGAELRSLLAVSQLIDEWSKLSIPLYITLACPSADDRDAAAHADLEVAPDIWKEPWQERAQAEWLDAYLPLFLAKEAVAGVFWSHYSDAAPHEFPHAGLLRANGQPKQALAEIVKYRRTYWQPGEPGD